MERESPAEPQKTTAELARDLVALEKRYERERAEQRQWLREQFSDLKDTIASLRIVPADLYHAEQKQQDLEISRLAGAIDSLRKFVWVSLLAPIALLIIGMVATFGSTF